MVFSSPLQPTTDTRTFKCGVSKIWCLGIGAILSAYATILLRQELAKAQPQPKSKKLIWSFMGFGIALFAMAALLQLGENGWR